MKRYLYSAFIIIILFTSCKGYVPEDNIEFSEEYVSRQISTMSLEEKVGQMFISAFRGSEKITPAMKSAIDDYHIGGVILFEENMQSKKQVKRLISDLQKKTVVPLFVAIDEEGGEVSRLNAVGDEFPSAASIGGSGDTAAAYKQGENIAAAIKQLGFNLNFAPVADISTNLSNMLVSTRAFSSEPELAAGMVEEFVAGLQEGGIAATLKHFPGHGDTETDSHYERASITHDMDRLKQKELIPFRAGIEAGADFVMLGLITAPNITGNDELIMFSDEIVTGLLREQLGFDGVVITDALNMGAVTKYYGSSGEVAVRAILAGVDILLMPYDLQKSYEAVIKAVEDERLSESRIDESLRRILQAKTRICSFR